MGFHRTVTDPAAYARHAFEAECGVVASSEHGRNDQLNRSSFVIGQLVGTGLIERAEAEHALFSAAQASGYVAKDGAPTTRSTIASGLDKGAREPREGLGGPRAAATTVTKPQPKREGVPLPSWTEPSADGKPKFFAIGKGEPPAFDDDLRRHAYWRDGQAVRFKVKKQAGPSPWVNFYRVRRPSDGAVGWQAKLPDGFVPVPYIGPPGATDPFVMGVGPVVWAEGEKDVDTLRRHGLAAFTFGSASDVPDCADLLRGHDLIVTGDHDAAGEKGIVRKIAMALPVAARVRAVRFPELPDGGDVSDFFERGGTAEAFVERAEEAHAEPSRSEPASPVAALVERFNAKYMVVNEAGKAIVLQPGFDPVLRRRRHDRMTVRDLQTLYMNELIEVGRDDKDRAITKPAADVWLKHPDRRQFINGITFDPTATNQDGVLNLWEGFAIEAAPGDWSLMREHIREVICDGDPIRFDYLMGWMARMLQHPAEQGEVAVVMRGGEGTGKGSLAKALMRIVGHHGLAIANAKHLVGNFNAHLRDVIFLFADEAFFAGDRSHIGALKSLITEPHLPLEGKFQNVVLAPNFLHLMMASNEEWVVPASLDARRFFVLEVPDSVKGDHAYFGRIWAEMEAGGYGAMLNDLLSHDLASFNVRAVPTTEGLQQQRKLSLPTTEAWWLDCLERGYVFRSKNGLHGEFGRWREIVSTELLFASYIEFAQARHERRLMTREHLGRFLVSLGAAPCRPAHGIIGEQIADIPNTYGGTNRKAEPIEKDRPPSYGVGSLDDARGDFTKTLRINLPWDGGFTDMPDPRRPSGPSGIGQGTRF